MGTTTIQTKPCPECGRAAQELSVPDDAALRYYNGATIQSAFPMLSADERELLISGLHSECWERLMALYDEELVGEET